jgi:GT2 family glycosyltransferase
MEPKVVAIIVAFNRANLLKETLDALYNQSYTLDNVIVINNASTDNTFEVAKRHKINALVYNSKQNTGGAGGFAKGLSLALKNTNGDFFWLMDDDVIPEQNALKMLINTFNEYKNTYKQTPAVLTSKAIWVDGKNHPMNTPRQNPFTSAKRQKNANKIGATDIRTASFVSFLVKREFVEKYGLPYKKFFIWNDDFEYSARILKTNIGLYVPQSVVLHKTAYFGNAMSIDPKDKFYYEVRNKIWALYRTKSFYFYERITYILASKIRWLRIIAKSKNKKLLLKLFFKGAKDGFFTNFK